MEMKQNLNDGDILQLCRIKLNLGEIYVHQHKDKEAMAILEEVLLIFNTLQKEEAIKEVINCLNLMACLHKSQKKYDDSIKLLEKAISMALENKENLSDLATSYCLKAQVLDALAQFGEAILNAEKSLKIRQEMYGKEHPEVATCLHVLGNINKHENRFDEALEYYHQALKIRLEFLGEFHPSLLESYSNIGLIHSVLEEYDRCLENYLKCLDVQIKNFGEDHSEVVLTYCRIGQTFFENNEFEKALEYYNIALNIKIKKLDPNHCEIADLYMNIGAVHHDQQNFSKALENYMKALKIQMSHFKEDKLISSANFYNLCLLFLDSNNLKTSKEFCKMALLVFKKTRRRFHQDTKDAEKQMKFLQRKIDRLNPNQPESMY